MPKHPPTYAIDNEERALDSMHKALEDHPEGLTARALADATGLGIGYVEGLLDASTLVIRRKAKGSDLWIADWSEVEENFRPSGISIVSRRGRPRTLKLSVERHPEAEIWIRRQSPKSPRGITPTAGQPNGSVGSA